MGGWLLAGAGSFIGVWPEAGQGRAGQAGAVWGGGGCLASAAAVL